MAGHVRLWNESSMAEDVLKSNNSEHFLNVPNTSLQAIEFESRH